MATLTRLTIHKFRRVAEKTELRFSQGFNVLLGRNATGKTTLLELVSMALAMDFSSLSEEEFHFEFELSSGEYRLVATVRNIARTGPSPELPVASPDARTAMRIALTPSVDVAITGPDFRVDIEASGSSYKARGSSFGEHAGTISLSLLAGHMFGSLLWELASWADAQGKTVVLHTIVQFFRLRPVRYDESLKYFDSISTGARLHFTKAKDGKLDWTGYRVVPTAMVRTALETLSKSNEPPNPLTMPALSHVEAVVRSIGYAAAYVEFGLKERTVADDGTVEIDYAGSGLFLADLDGSIAHSGRLSFGQRRFLGFGYWLDCVSEVAIADELVNGLHHEWIRQCVELMKGRQSFIASQNPLLLDHLGFESPEDVRSSFVLCRRALRGERVALEWSSMSAGEAGDFYEAYKVGIQSISEILEEQELW